MLITKFDSPNGSLDKKLSYAIQNCNELGLPYMMFQTDHDSFKLSKEEREKQNLRLCEKLDSVNHYLVSDLSSHFDRMKK